MHQCGTKFRISNGYSGLDESEDPVAFGIWWFLQSTMWIQYISANSQGRNQVEDTGIKSALIESHPNVSPLSIRVQTYVRMYAKHCNSWTIKVIFTIALMHFLTWFNKPKNLLH